MSKEEFRKELVHLYNNGRSVDDICTEYDVPKSTFYRWMKKYREESPKLTENDIKLLIMKIAVLEEENSTYRKAFQVLSKGDK